MGLRSGHLRAVPNAPPPPRREIGGFRPVSSLYDPPLEPLSWAERERIDREYALLRHRARRRFQWLTLLPHGCVALIAWSMPLPHFSVPFTLALSITLLTHVLIVLNARPPAGVRKPE